VNYIQSDYAGDPRQFYYGIKRGQMVQTQSTFNQKSYARMVDIGEGQLRDRKDMNEEEKQRVRGLRNGPINGRFGDRERASGTLQALSPGVAGVAYDSVSVTDGAKRPMMKAEFGAGANKMKSAAETVTVAQEPAVQVRSDFRSTILWQPDLKTDNDGHATVKIKYPDSLQHGKPLREWLPPEISLVSATVPLDQATIDCSSSNSSLLCGR
jgi:hypothetical protein